MVRRHDAARYRHGDPVGVNGGVRGGDDDATPRPYVYELSLDRRHTDIYATYPSISESQ